MNPWNTLADDTVTIVAIAAIVAVAVLGVGSGSTEVVVGAIAGLGGYRMSKASKSA